MQRTSFVFLQDMIRNFGEVTGRFRGCTKVKIGDDAAFNLYLDLIAASSSLYLSD